MSEKQDELPQLKINAPSSEVNPEAADEAHRAAIAAKREAEATRDYVLSRFKKLRGEYIPIEVLQITNLPSHNCLIINDLLLLSYVEAKELLEQIPDE